MIQVGANRVYGNVIMCEDYIMSYKIPLNYFIDLLERKKEIYI